ncbi:ATP-binding protein [Noviherbaspirillum sp.]|uniref:ATP-binding protein n=1 Tax=Noviherbaspirillum sp. TaxID=1926288 RepID=UPI002B45EFE6|nr:ATP-binding protein [Noviherbaspirillum sp.]HJV80165.1 ATP-binding protein [Noviherbaspirillum sp.]
MEFTTPAELEIWLEELHSLANRKQCTAPRFIKPFHLATLAHKMRLTNLSSLNLPEKIAPYANTMMLWEALGLTPPEIVVQRNAAGRYHPIEVLRDQATVEDTADTLIKLLAPVCSDAKTLDSVNTMLRELVDNCYSHSDVKDGIFGLICAQVWAGGKKAQIAIADTGVGIRTSLSMNEKLAPRLKLENCCELATEYGVTGKPGKGHSGYGLAVAKKLMELNNGNLIVRSGTEGFSLRIGKMSRFNTKHTWHGTLLIIEWDIHVPMNIGDVYKSFPLPEGMTDDDFNF